MGQRPLLVRDPGEAAGHVRDAYAGLVDVPGTVRSRLGHDAMGGARSLGRAIVAVGVEDELHRDGWSPLYGRMRTPIVPACLP